MVLHISGKLVAVGLVIAALITAFSTPRSPPADAVPLAVTPVATVADAPVALPTGGATQPVGPIANPVYVLRATGYNSLAGQTDHSPHITATGQRTRLGIIAVSRDMLHHELPYGSLVRIRDLGNYGNGRGYGKFQALLDTQGLFVVEDTMHQRKQDQVDIWFGDYASAVNWGVRRVAVEVVRYGRDGPELLPAEATTFSGTPRLASAN